MPFRINGRHSMQGPIPSVACVYGIEESANVYVYIGETDDLARRIAEHLGTPNHCMHRYSPHAAVYEAVMGGAQVRRDRETTLTAEYKPPCNA